VGDFCAAIRKTEINPSARQCCVVGYFTNNPPLSAGVDSKIAVHSQIKGKRNGRAIPAARDRCSSFCCLLGIVQDQEPDQKDS
jgi:hypothetical protein